MSNLTFLTQEQCFESDELDILKKRGTKAAITDFSILLGGYVNDDYHIDSDDSLEGRTGVYWTRSGDGPADARVVRHDGDRARVDVCVHDIGARPALLFSSISSIPTNGVSGRPKRARDGVLEVEYGYYPQKAVSRDLQQKLERAFQTRRLSTTGKKYTTDSRKDDDDYYEEEFSPQQYEEFELDGKRYVRVQANSCFDGKEFTLSNGERYKDGDFVWVEVSPVKWLVDEKAKIMLTDKVIFSGVQFKHTRDYRTEDFERTDIKTFMDRHLSKELEQSREVIEVDKQSEEILEVQPRKSRLQKLNPDKTKEASRARMTDTEIIQNWIESGESVLLRGPSGIGKTERIKSLYPDLIYIKLTNNMFPEKVVGSVNLQTGQSIPPDFAKTAILQEATEEERKMVEENLQSIFDIADTIYERSKTSDKKVVIMLDELLNVKPAVQSLVYTLVLNRMVEIGKGLKLPDNVVVVATGNQKKYSVVAEDLAEPLEKKI